MKNIDNNYENLFEINNLNSFDQLKNPNINKTIKINNDGYQLMVDFTEKCIIYLTLIKHGDIFKYQSKIEVSSAMKNREMLVLAGFNFEDLISSIINDDEYLIKEIIPNKEFEINFSIENKIKNKIITEKFSFQLIRQSEVVSIDEIDAVHNSIINSNTEGRLNSIDAKISNIIHKLDLLELNTVPIEEMKRKDDEIEKLKKDLELEKNTTIIKLDALYNQLQSEKQINETNTIKINSLNEEIKKLLKEKEDFINKSQIECKTNNNTNEQLKLNCFLPSTVKFVRFEASKLRTSDEYSGTNKIEDINNFDDRSLMKGITVLKNGWATFEMEREVEFQEIEIGLFQGHSNWTPERLNGATVFTSKDNSNWTKVGIVNNDTYEIKKVSLIKSSAKFIKIDHRKCKNFIGISYGLGIGYLKVINLN